MKFINLLNLLALVPCAAFVEDGTIFDTIIIGAGWAGISTAKKLKSMGFTNFTVLEARNRIGGRSYTSYEFGESIPQDMGSYYLTSSEENPLFDYLDETSITPVLQDPTPLVFLANGTIISDQAYQDLSDQYWRPFYGVTDGEEEDFEDLYFNAFFYQEFNETWNGLNFTDDDISPFIDADVPLQDVIDKYLNVSNITDSEILSFFEMHVERWITSDYAGSTTDLSFLWFDESEWYNGSSFYVAQKNMQEQLIRKKLKEQKMKKVSLKNGFKALVDAYADEVLDKIELSSKVTEINYDADPIEVTFEIEDSTLVTIKADTVVVTVPVGVLRAGDINFIPSLDDGSNRTLQEFETKEYALNHIGPGKIIHCALYWEDLDESDIFWPNNSSFIQFIAEEPSLQGRFTQWINFYHFNGNIPILMGTVNGDHVDDMVDMTDEDIMEEAVVKLEAIFGEIPSPTKFIVHNWLTDEFTKSAYSYNQEDYYYSRWYLRQSLPGPSWNLENARLHFAGEGTSDYYFGLIQGAIWEGERAAIDVGRRLEFFSGSSSPSEAPTEDPTEDPSMPPSESPFAFFLQTFWNLFLSILDFVESLIFQ